jgi:phage shock protein E
MSNKRRNRASGPAIGGSKRQPAPAVGTRNRLYLGLLAGGLAILFVAVAGYFLLGGSGSGSNPAPSQASGVSIHQGNGGQWSNVTPDKLASMLQQKDFTFVNVKTPYIGEITGTDLYIPYDQITARKAELPQAKDAKILVYCRSGAESAVASQTLLTLGYTNVWNLDGGMNAWTASGRTLINLNR